MENFYTISDNSFHTRGFPWISKINSGREFWICSVCEKPVYKVEGDIAVELDPRKGTRWPDTLGIGAGPMLFIVSKKFVDAYICENLGELNIGGEVNFAEPIPKKLRLVAIPKYFWIDGQKQLGADFDFETSGFTKMQSCLECGSLLFDTSKVSSLERIDKYPNAIFDGSWNGMNLFTTDLSPTKFFCTRKVLELAYKHQLTNFRFLTIEQGADAANRGIDYLPGKLT